MSSYGAWITKDDIITVSEECHPEEAYKILAERFNRHNTIFLKKFTVYKIMARLGYVRLINYKDNTYKVEYWQAAKLSKFQKEIIAEAESKHPIKIYGYEWNNDKVQ